LGGAGVMGECRDRESWGEWESERGSGAGGVWGEGVRER
jgi:hypothetical protein